jgi:hypothetical protein
MNARNSAVGDEPVGQRDALEEVPMARQLVVEGEAVSIMTDFVEALVDLDPGGGRHR